MSTHEFVQHFAKLFEHYTCALALDDSQYEIKSGNSCSTDDDHRMVAAARLAILELETNAKMERNARKYFAKPGEAEWGC